MRIAVREWGAHLRHLQDLPLGEVVCIEVGERLEPDARGAGDGLLGAWRDETDGCIHSCS